MNSQHPAPRAPGARERTRASWGLLGFYTSCAGVAIGAAVAACGYAWFGSLAALVVGGALALGSAVTCLYCLRRARA